MAAEAGAEAAPARVRRGRGWLLAMLLSAVALCSAITLAHLVHQRRLAEITSQLLALKQAGADIDEAFLHLQLGGDAQSPWQRSQGLALLAQADAELRELGRATEQQAAVAEIGNAIGALRERWASAGSAPVADRAGEVQARLALHALRQRLAELDDAMATRSEEAARRLDRMFDGTLALAALLLAGVGWGMVRSERERATAQRGLLRSERQQRSTLAALSEGVVLLDAQGRVARANPAAAQLLGGDLEGRLPTLLQALEPADGSPPASACQLEVPGRGLRVFSLRRDPLPGGESDGKAGPDGGAVLSFADVTDERAAMAQLAAHRERLEELVQARTQALEQALAAQREVETFAQTVTDAQPTLLAYWDRELRLRFVNKAYLDWFGFSRDAVLGRTMVEVLGEAEVERQRANIGRVLAGEAFEAAQPLQAGGGGSGRFWVYRLPMRRQAQIEGYIFVATNITALRHAEERLAAMNVELARRAELAEQATRAKSAFLANMSHEIRTPMNAITGLTHLLLREVEEPGQRERLAKIDVAARHLLKVINDILDLSKIEAGRLELAERDFAGAELVTQALAMVADEARERGLALTADTGRLPPRLRGDPQRLSQALLNLLSNAVKFTPRGWVRVLARAEPEADGQLLLRIEVHDSGIGVTPERLQALFTPFEQADNSITRRFGGTGLGLALTRHLATLMGGEAGASSEPGRGSRFWFSARVRPAQGGAAAPVAGDAVLLPAEDALRLLRQHHAGQRVLLAEDNPVNQDVATALLLDAGIEVDLAADGAQAVAMASERPYALVLMDVQMPGLDGLQATRELRRLGHAEPVLAMTANAFAEDRMACLAAGMNDHLGKPVQPEELYAALLRWLPPSGPSAPPAPAASTAVPASPLPSPAPAAPTAATTAPSPAAELQARLAAVDGLDATQALRNVAGNPRALERVLRAFFASYAHGVPALLQPVTPASLPELRAACHALRGACAAVGAVPLSRQLLTLEQRLSSTADPTLPALAVQAHEALVALVDSLAKALDT